MQDRKLHLMQQLPITPELPTILTIKNLIIAYKDAGNSNYGTAVIGTVSGTSISFSAEQVFNASETNWCTLAYDTTNNKMMLGYRDYGNSNFLTVREITSSGSTLTFGTTFINNSATIEYTSSAFDPDTGTTFLLIKRVREKLLFLVQRRATISLLLSASPKPL